MDITLGGDGCVRWLGHTPLTPLGGVMKAIPTSGMAFLRLCCGSGGVENKVDFGVELGR